MVIKTRKEKDVVVVSVKGRMDAITAPDFDKKMDEVMDAGNRYFVLNFGKLEYISSAGLRSILLVGKKLQTTDGKVIISDLRDPVKEIFDISGFGSIFQIVGTDEAALEQF